jgi:hypothetical protein
VWGGWGLSEAGLAVRAQKLASCLNVSALSSEFCASCGPGCLDLEPCPAKALFMHMSCSYGLLLCGMSCSYGCPSA